MRWPSWSPSSRPRRLCVAGLDVGPDACRLVVLSGSSSQPDTVCCAERLALPEAWVAHGEVLQPVELGGWLRTYLDVHDFQPTLTYLGLDGACVSNHLVTLVVGLSAEDVVFQLQAEVQSVLPDHAREVCIDYRLDAEPSPVGQQRYLVQAAPRLRVEALQRVAHVAGLKAVVVEPRQEAACRTERSHVLAALPQVSAALALQCDEAFGLALRAWDDEGVNFYPTARTHDISCAALGCWRWLCAPWAVRFWRRVLRWSWPLPLRAHSRTRLMWQPRRVPMTQRTRRMHKLKLRKSAKPNKSVG